MDAINTFQVVRMVATSLVRLHGCGGPTVSCGLEKTYSLTPTTLASLVKRVDLSTTTNDPTDITYQMGASPGAVYTTPQKISHHRTLRSRIRVVWWVYHFPTCRTAVREETKNPPWPLCRARGGLRTNPTCYYKLCTFYEYPNDYD